jgi:RNA-directed DNA polymerase
VAVQPYRPALTFASRITVKTIRRRYCNGGWWLVTTEIGLFDPAKMRTRRYRHREAAIPAPWPVSG